MNAKQFGNIAFSTCVHVWGCKKNQIFGLWFHVRENLSYFLYFCILNEEAKIFGNSHSYYNLIAFEL